MKQFVFLFLGTMLALSAHAADSDISSEDYKLTKIKKIVIKTASGKIYADEGAANNGPYEACESFSVTEDMVKTFFKYVHQVSEDKYNYELESSACYAEGSVVFANKDVGEWMISRYGKGTLTVRTGDSTYKEKKLLLFCEKCSEGQW